MADTSSKYLAPNTTRLRDTEFAYPVVIGTAAFYLGKKASEYQSHKWTVYVRGLNDEDISHIIRKVTFNLHVSFNNPQRAVEAHPYELTETGWGEFEIGVVLHFQPDAQEKDLEIFHRLKLYADDDPTGMANVKKPVINEQVEELVFVNPHEAFYQRVRAHQPRPAAPLSIATFLSRPAPDDDLRALQDARHKVAQLAAGVRAQLAAAAGGGGGGGGGGGELAGTPMDMMSD